MLRNLKAHEFPPRIVHFKLGFRPVLPPWKLTNMIYLWPCGPFRAPAACHQSFGGTSKTGLHAAAALAQPGAIPLVVTLLSGSLACDKLLLWTWQFTKIKIFRCGEILFRSNSEVEAILTPLPRFSRDKWQPRRLSRTSCPKSFAIWYDMHWNVAGHMKNGPTCYISGVSWALRRLQHFFPTTGRIMCRNF